MKSVSWYQQVRSEPELITKVASGGELSRIILAIKSMKSATHNQHLIFDEIDPELADPPHLLLKS